MGNEIFSRVLRWFMTSENIPIWAVLLVAALAVGFDVRTRRIPNLLTFGAAGLACSSPWQTAGFSGMTTALSRGS